VITVPGIVLGFAASFLPGSSVDPLDSAKGAVGGYLGFAAVAWGYQRLRHQEGLGQGDWKLAAMLGAFLGWKRLGATVFLASRAMARWRAWTRSSGPRSRASRPSSRGATRAPSTPRCARPWPPPRPPRAPPSRATVGSSWPCRATAPTGPGWARRPPRGSSRVRSATA